MYQPPQQPQQDYSQWQQPNTQYSPQPPPLQQWQQPPRPAPTMMHPQREVRMEVKVAALVCFAIALVFAAVGIPFLTLLAGLALLTGIVLVFLI